MSLSRTTARTRVLQRMDATSSGRWTTTAVTGEVDQLLGHVVDKEWRDILTRCPEVRLASVSATSSASTGRYNISDLSTGSGNSVQRFYRLQSVIIDNIPYRETKFIEFPMGEPLGLNLRVYWREGDYIMTLPKTLSKAGTFWVNHLPVRVENLVADSDNIVFPDGYEELYLLETAAMLLAKGGAETGAAAELKSLASTIRDDMMEDLMRIGRQPVAMAYDDMAADWAG